MRGRPRPHFSTVAAARVLGVWSLLWVLRRRRADGVLSFSLSALLLSLPLLLAAPLSCPTDVTGLSCICLGGGMGGPRRACPAGQHRKCVRRVHLRRCTDAPRRGPLPPPRRHRVRLLGGTLGTWRRGERPSHSPLLRCLPGSQALAVLAAVAAAVLACAAPLPRGDAASLPHYEALQPDSPGGNGLELQPLHEPGSTAQSSGDGRDGLGSVSEVSRKLPGSELSEDSGGKVPRCWTR